MSTRPQRTRPAGASLLVPATQPLKVGDGTPGVPESVSAGVPVGGRGEEQRGGAPKYARMPRRDLRLRDDQIAGLGTLRRRIAGQRRERSERITDNTLVRVAIDVLLAHGEHLAGATEEEILQSVRRAVGPQSEAADGMSSGPVASSGEVHSVTERSDRSA